jgi:putative transposase
MLTPEDFETWCLRLKFSGPSRALIQAIRLAPPSRRVRAGMGNMAGRYPSRKMGVAIQFESHRNELATIYEMEHDPVVLEFYDQPQPIKLLYPAKNGRQLGVMHVADFFVLRTDAAGWVECKTEEELSQLADRMPHRYVRNPDGRWHCPPGEAHGEPLGLFYELHSSSDIDWVYQRNLRMLEDYFVR